MRELYETDRNVPGYYLAGSTYGPSYLTFESALGYHFLIPEAIYLFASVVFEKENQKYYATSYGTLTIGTRQARRTRMELNYKRETAMAFRSQPRKRRSAISCTPALL
ncbi:hypothetical protein HCH52_01115 [Oscillospiraceae bacterium HV4-5-C5C]|nr:hypothetical protein [Oscillospiraceae bacterium HV4-5-C5C]